jgi:Holliday junction resolvase RusA-like endonuclease
MDPIIFLVEDMAPAPQGSKVHVGKGVMIESCKNVKPWRLLVAKTAITLCQPACNTWADWQWAAWLALRQAPDLTAAELLKAVGPRRYQITLAAVSGFLPDLRSCMARQDAYVLHGPVRMSAVFRFQRPANHYRRDGTLKPLNAALSSATSKEAPLHHCVKPDSSKLQRSTEDALSNLAFEDDARICDMVIKKRWCVGDERLGALITLIPLSRQQRSP